MILELDLGNTRAKWRILNAKTEIVARGVDDVTGWLRGNFPAAWTADIQRVRIASVLSPSTEVELSSKIQSALSVTPQIARSSSYCSGVASAYADPERLGVDRWLALIAAYKKSNKAVLVIDIGTALKVDAVNDAGRHRGGYIIPGADLMQRALFDGTDRVRYEGHSFLENVALGSDTRACVQNGITAALTGAVLIAIEQCRLVMGSPLIYMTGGLGLQMVDCLEIVGIRNICFEADLVLDGLRWVLP